MEEDSVRVEGRSSWVVDMKKMLVDPEELYSVEMARWKKPSIYRVPERTKRMLTNIETYHPQVLSLGPFHHGEPDLMPMEEHKHRAVLHLVTRARKPLGEFIAAIEGVANTLQDAYDGLGEEWRGANTGQFVEVMVADGCFLLEMMTIGRLVREGKVSKDYAPNDPVFSDHGYHVWSPDIRSDMVLMENQLPLLVLQRLSAVQYGTALGQSAKEINKMALLFLGHAFYEGMDNLGLHPLDVLHKSFCGFHPNLDGCSKWQGTMPSAVELQEAGISFKDSNSKSILDVNFDNGVLRMPQVKVYGDAEKEFINLMAFERLHSDAGTYVTDYIFLALLKSKGLVKHGMGSDNEVAQLFNTIGYGAVVSSSSKLASVKQKVIAHCAKPWNKWRASFVQTYLSNPWVFISLLAAAILLVATLMQTVYTVIPFYTKN